jgi:PAS domain S-box-containing protein
LPLALLLKQQWEMQEMELKNQKLNDQLAIIFELSPTGIILCDLRGFITFANRRMTEMLGHRVEELVGNDYLEFVHPDDFTSAMEKQQALMESTLRTIDDERRFVRKDGTSFRGHLTASHFGDETARQNGLVCLINSI